MRKGGTRKTFRVFEVPVHPTPSRGSKERHGLITRHLFSDRTRIGVEGADILTVSIGGGSLVS